MNAEENVEEAVFTIYDWVRNPQRNLVVDVLGVLNEIGAIK